MAPSHDALRTQIVRACHLLHRVGLVAGRDGNISARVGPDRWLVTPTMSHKAWIEADDLVVVDRAGVVVDGDRPPSTEWRMHAAIYATRPDVRAVVHAHPPFAVATTMGGRPFDPAWVPEALVSLGRARVVPYATTGTEDLANAVAAALIEADGALLERHGAVTVGADVEAATARMESLEHAARIGSLAGPGATSLPDDEQVRLLALAARGR